MPYIKTRTNTLISEEKENIIKEELGKAIVNLGKSESWLMVDFDDNCRLYFKGDKNVKNAYVEVKLFGSASDASKMEMTREITNIISSNLDINPSNIYVSYFETESWGWNGSNF